VWGWDAVNEMRMPPLSQTSDELKVVEWLKQQNDPVSAGEEIVLIETDKANLAVESAYNGTLHTIVAAAGETVQAGDLLAYIGQPGEVIPLPEEASRGRPAATEGRPRQDIRIEELRGEASVQAPAAPAPAGKVLTSPAARQLAAAHGLDLSSVPGSGPGGRIEVDDVRRAAGKDGVDS
jgi:pyruvate/2-oxoglutarate dehydrogenase complex dihydrolipoamide acyltransferase (E2) component